jgi:hypothetical protein
MSLMPTLGDVGFRAGLAACAATIGYDVVQILQVAGVLHFPLDEILIFATSLCIVLPFVFEMLALHYSRRPDEQLWTHAALIFTTMYAVFGTANYVIQLTTVIPAKMRGAAATVSVLEQTPHSLLWDFDAIAYIAMGIAALVIIPALRATTLERRARLASVAHVAATALSGIVYFRSPFTNRLLILGFPWAITAPLFMLLLALVLRTERGETSRSPAAPPTLVSR